MGGGCQVDGCDLSATTRGYCEMHYRRVLRTGKPGPPGPLRARGLCKVDGCDQDVDAKGLCHGHYQRLLRGRQSIQTALRGSSEECRIEGCDRDVQAKGYCGAHYKRILTHGHPQADVPIKTVTGKGFVHHGYRWVPIPKKLRYLSHGRRTMAEAQVGDG